MSFEEVAEVMRHQTRQIVDLRIEIDQREIKHKKEVRNLILRKNRADFALHLACRELALQGVCLKDQECGTGIEDCAKCMLETFEGIAGKDLKQTEKAWSHSTKNKK